MIVSINHIGYNLMVMDNPEIKPIRTGIRFLLVLVSAALLVSSFYGPGFLAWFCLVPFFIALRNSRLGQTVFFSFILALAYFAGVTYWFTEYSFVFWLPILAIVASYITIIGIAFYYINAKIKSPALRILLVSSAWMAVEFFRSRTFLAFPWGLLAYSQHEYLEIMQIVGITGVYGVSLILILANTSIAETVTGIIRERKVSLRKFRYMLPVVGLLVIILVYGLVTIGLYRDKPEEGESIDIALVQTNITFDDKFEKDSGVLIPDPYSNERYFKEGTELVVYPETVLWGTLERNKTFGDWVKETIKNEDLHFITGQVLWDEEDNYYNTVNLYSPDTEIIGRYNKIHPLPCAEYMPYPDVLFMFKFLNIAKTNITPVMDFEMIQYPGKGNLGTNICFESTLPLISRTFRDNGAEAIFVFTDDAGFRESLASWQHVIFSRVRAIENGCYLVHSSNMGVSAVIDPIGELKVRTPLGEKMVVYERVYLNSKKSFYAEYGNLVLYGFFGLSFLCLIIYIVIYFRIKRGKLK
jgi:apolipoprotein N-acyltransferase